MGNGRGGPTRVDEFTSILRCAPPAVQSIRLPRPSINKNLRNFFFFRQEMNPISRISAPRPSRASMEGVSPLMYSCQQGDVQQVRSLLQRKVFAGPARLFFWLNFHFISLCFCSSRFVSRTATGRARRPCTIAQKTRRRTSPSCS